MWNTNPLFDLLYQLHITLCLFVIPLCFMVLTYTSIVKVLWGSIPAEKILSDKQRPVSYSQHTLTDGTAHSDDVSVHTPLNGVHKSSNLIVQENRQKAAKMLIAIVVIFAICYLPVHVFNLFRFVYVYYALAREKSPAGEANACFEPERVSLSRTDKFRRKFKELLQCCRCKRKKLLLDEKKMFNTSNINSSALHHDISTTTPNLNRTPDSFNNAKNNMHHLSPTRPFTPVNKRTGTVRLTNV
ncbi:unnamed protein product [Didymodactylos carnosus]|uniref:G-protein coupled receptors family 1 profile domain-containing protein n=1 Tax=Didymodactylos carnosus TaxID=1234261 RepID=A0A813UVG1_9BILA|nr:unnamed protein product [Didymodactylos carnosus]CAF3615566.1 unnamed protein product [Didymodactylos carnosus]